jgi:hypothetical protein
MGASLALLSMAILWVASGAVGPAVDGAVRGFGGFVNSVGTIVSSPEPTSAPSIADAPTVVAPPEAYTNDDVVDVTVHVPSTVAGADGYTVRLWVTLKDQEIQMVQEVPVAATSVLVIPEVELEKGRNDFQASIVGPGGESELSSVASWILDQSRPSIKISSPKDNASTSKTAVTVKGKTQANSTVRVRNDLNGASVTVVAGKDGLFEARIAIDSGFNTLTITSTDPAGNPNTESLTVRRGSGSMQVTLTGSAYRFTAKKLPRRVTFTVVVSSPDGRPVAGATTLFTVTVPGLEAIVSDEQPTDRNGVATFTTSIPRGAQAGSGLATVLVTAAEYGEKTDRQVLTVK